MQISLRKALNTKNKLVGKISEIKSQIQRYNVYNPDKGTIAERVDVSELLLDYFVNMNKLIDLKTAIVNANAGSDGSNSIYKTLVKIEETKAAIAFLKEVPAEDGITEQTDWRTDKVTRTVRKCHVSHEQLQQHIASLESGLEDLLEEADVFNGSTKIEVKL